ncbi:unnamed protein product, partial [Amoebophrya sp. A25]|eukprot:GSA25T00024885001.1
MARFLFSPSLLATTGDLKMVRFLQRFVLTTTLSGYFAFAAPATIQGYFPADPGFNANTDSRLNRGPG